MHKCNINYCYWLNIGISRGQNGGQRGQNVSISSKNEYYELDICNHTLIHIRKRLHKCNINYCYWLSLGVSWGQNGGQRGQIVPISRRNEYYKLATCNHTLNHIGKQTVVDFRPKFSISLAMNYVK